MPPVKRIKGRYEIKAKLGEGGMGVVYRAYDPAPMNRDVALKTLLEFPDRMSLQLFYKECEVLKSLSHPNIVEIFDIGEFEEGGQKKPYFVMPLLPGHTLDELIRNFSHRLSVERVTEIMAQTCRGLQAAHERGLVHRDLKPSNILVMDDDSVKIIDFGVVHTLDSRSRTNGFQKGTLLYMAPEQVQYQPVSAQSDIFSLAVVCYEALTRKQLFRGETEDEIVEKILKYIPPPASELNPAVSQTMSRVIHKAMAKKPWNRFDTAREFGETLQKALRNQPIELFDTARIQPRIDRATKALEGGDFQFAKEIVDELEAEGNIDPQLVLLRTQIDRVVRQRTIAQLLESARARYEEEEDPLALQKIQEILQMDPDHGTALALKSKIEDRRSERQIEKWLRLAQQHIANHSYARAREAMQNALQLRPGDARAVRLAAEIESDEQEYLRLRKEKSELYQSAMNAWKNGDVSGALSQMGLVLDLDRRAPDTTSSETSKAYQIFYNKVRSEHDAINIGYAEARRNLAGGDFAKALKACDDLLAKYPGQAIFQALKFDIDEQQRQQLSGFVANVDRRLDAEPDLDAKISLLREAVATLPDEPHFQRSLKMFQDKRDLVDSIAARAKLHEERRQFTEALNDLETLKSIYSPYPGLQFEIDRLEKCRDQMMRDAAKSSNTARIDQRLSRGEYAVALELIAKALAEFPEDAELAELEKLAQRNLENSQAAEQLMQQGQELRSSGKLEEGIEHLRKALQLDEKNSSIRDAAVEALLERARQVLAQDRRAAEVLIQEVVNLDPGNPQARSLYNETLDHERNEMVEQMVSAARRLQADQKTEDAVAELEKGLALFPSDPRLRTLHDTLRVELGQASRKKARLSDLNELRNLRQNARNATRTDELRSIYERTQNVAARYQEEPEFQSAAREIERLVRARAPSSRREVDVFSTGTKSKSRLVLIAGVAAALLLIVGFAFVVRALFYRSSLIRIATVPSGATVTVAGQSCADSNCQLQLREGTYTAEAHLDGYHPSSQSFTVKSGNRNATITLILKPLEGVSPAKGIAATNESSLASQSSVVTTLPAPARGLSKGTLKVIASAGRARSTALANADVIVDGRYYGQTGTDGTFSLPLQPGQYTVTLRKDGYSVPEKGTNVRAGEDTTLRFTAQPAAGATQVLQAAESNPVTSGAGTLQKVNPPPVQVATNTPPSGGINNSTPGAVEPLPNIATRSSSTGSGAPAQPAPSASTVVANPRNRESADTNATPSLLVSDKKAIATALEQYKDAYESESLDELLKIWPSMSKDQKKALRAAFESAQAIRISLACGDPTILGDAATVKCNQEVKYTRAGKVEPPQTVSIDILLTRKRTVWLVATLRAN